MTQFLKFLPPALLLGILLGLTANTAQAGGDPPNWKGAGSGTTDRLESGIDVETFAGKSSHLGKFTGLGFHVLDPIYFTFEGQATWTAANGDTLSVTYAGQLFPSGDPDYPYGFVATLTAVGGTGRFSSATGVAEMTGGFTGQFPGELYFEFEGTLSLHGK